MQCPIQNTVSADILLDYCARKLNAESMALFEKHVETCAECQQFATGQKAVLQALESWEAEPVSSDFDAKLYARIEEHELGSWPKRIWMKISAPFGWKTAMPAAAVCATLAIAVMVYQPNRAYVPAANERTRVEALEAEQVERTLEDLEMLTQLAGPVNSQSL